MESRDIIVNPDDDADAPELDGEGVPTITLAKRRLEGMARIKKGRKSKGGLAALGEEIVAQMKWHEKWAYAEEQRGISVSVDRWVFTNSIRGTTN